MSTKHRPSSFDRLFENVQRDKNARMILLGMGVAAVVLLILVLPPVSLLSGGGSDDPGPNQGNGASGVARSADGLESLSRVFSLDKPRGTTGPYAVTLNLEQPTTDGRNIGFYTNRNDKWEFLAAANLTSNGTAVTGEVPDIPSKLAVMRRTADVSVVSGWLPANSQADAKALQILTTLNPVDYTPNADGSLAGAPSPLPNTKGSVIPTVRAPTSQAVEAVNTVLASQPLREAHVNALLQVAMLPGNSGLDIDYRNVNTARKSDLTAFVSLLADRLHQASRQLTITIPSPTKAGVNWDTGAYDWDALATRVDGIKLLAEQDPSVYYDRMEEVLTFLEPRVDLKKVVLVIGRASYEKGSDGLRPISLREALTIASEIEVRTTSQITPNASVVIVGRNIFKDDGASGLRWDPDAFAVSFSYPGRGGQRTVWIENSLSVAFKVDLARRFGLGGIALNDAASDPLAPDIWDTLRVYAETGNVNLVQPNSVLLRPTWLVQAGNSEPNANGNIVWRAPAQPGSYDVTLVVSDGVMRAAQKIVLTVGNTSPTPGGTSTARPSVTPTVRP